MDNFLYATDLGKYYVGKSEKILTSNIGKELKNKVQLIITSPPFPLNKKKRYGNLKGEEYKEWFVSFAELFSELLTDDGSIVLELGNSWEPYRPVQSVLQMESLLAFLKSPKADLRLCQEFICYNPSRIPSPAQWVTINRIRTVDSFTRVWWMSKTDYPKADNQKVLRPYSKSMKNLLKRQSYNSGKRPSEHNVSETGFLKDHNGSIMPNVIELEPSDEKKELRLPFNLFSMANTNSNDFFSKTCREREIQLHPARMKAELASFFIEFLTDSNDLVLDPFAGSNTTGFCAEKLGRRWIAVEVEEKYGYQSAIRFEDPSIETNLIMKNKTQT